MQPIDEGATPTELLDCSLEYIWKPFTFQGRHLSFQDHRISRLSERDCCHWGPAVYKWEGLVRDGGHAGSVGVLIGETGDLRQRIKQYVSGTQESGNRYCREQFLNLGEIYLYILGSPKCRVKGQGFQWGLSDLTGNNVRLIWEQLIVLREVSKGERWVVNRKL